MKHVSIVGFGRFGQTLYHLLKDDFSVTVYKRNNTNNEEFITDDLTKIYEAETIFFATPISSFEDVIKIHQQYFQDHHVLIDVLSVKLHPKKIFEKYLQDKKTQALLTHPMFGPDSAKNGFENLPVIIDKFKANDDSYSFWKDFFAKKKLRVIEMSADEHDKLAANSQGLTHFIGRVLEKIDMHPTMIDSLGTKKLLEVKEQTCNDTWELFTDLQHFNPYTKQMRIQLGEAYDKLYNTLLPEHIQPGVLTIGIQGGRGSFNEEAVQYYLQTNNIERFEIVYLHRSERVLQQLHAGEIDHGLFAIHNSQGGVVGESLDAMAKYKFAIVKEFAIKISHALMIRKDVSFSDVTTVMAHPQVFAQCKNTLAQKYPKLHLTSGEGESIDHALAAKLLYEGKLPKETAIMGSKVLADIYGLQVVEDNLQDLHENYTSFLMVKRFT